MNPRLCLILTIIATAALVGCKKVEITGATVCTVEQPHITYGGKFGRQMAGDAVWTVSVVSRTGCTSSEVTLVLDNGVKLPPYSSNSYLNPEKDYSSTAFFFRLTERDMKLATTWTVLAKSQWVGPFTLPKTLPRREFQPSRWLVIADMDDSSYSAPTIELLKRLAKEEKFDGVIHNGDYAYNIHNSKGRVGDNYFATFSKVSSLVPYIVTPGNHEKFDQFKMFNYRFQMPGAGAGLSRQAANYYSFIVKGIYFVTINWDYAFLIEGQNNFREVFDWLKADLQKAAADPTIMRRIFFTHKPFYCTFVDPDCVNFYLFKPVEALLFKHKFDVILNAHVHLYYRHKKLDSLMRLVPESALVPSTLISGHQGVDPLLGGNNFEVKDARRGRLELSAQAGSPNILIMESSAEGLQFSLRSCDSLALLDSLQLRQRPGR